ncbi:hypothetical protein J6590_011164 [Homalodisca vitripennis]|nr:hypothetical protein J6590_011164 [Homalodisca vitripennis]
MVVEELERQDSTLRVFLDLSKTFNCVDHVTILEKFEYHGIRGVPFQVAQSFVEINNCVQHFNSLNLKTNSAKSNFLNFALRSGGRASCWLTPYWKKSLLEIPENIPRSRVDLE